MLIPRKLSASSRSKENEVDRISKLPDAVIHCILSFIETKYAVQTSVLSKRWIDIWKSLSFLNFDMYDSTLRKLSDLVDGVLLRRDDCNIIWFKLRCKWYYSGEGSSILPSLDRWIDAAMKRNIQEVTLELCKAHGNFTFQIPLKLLNCRSLKRLSLISYNIYVNLALPKSMSLPQLKFVSLGGLVMPNVELSARLFSSCPLLETLHISNCDMQTDDQKNFTIESPSLKTFKYTLLYLGSSIKPKIILLSAPNLTSFDAYYGDEKQQLSIEEKEVNTKFLMKLLVGVEKVERLDLSLEFLEALSTAPYFLSSQHHCLCNLRSLRLETRITGGSLRQIAYLLTISPNMKTLTLRLNGPNIVDIGDDWDVRFSLPGMQLPHLNIVRIEETEGGDAELKILGFLLKNGTALKEVALYFRSSVGSSDRLRQVKQFSDKLRALPTACSNIKMMFF